MTLQFANTKQRNEEITRNSKRTVIQMLTVAKKKVVFSLNFG